eukprot:scaffold84158_cov45-Phaeocystis_antarctica.AAC.1
MPLTKRAASHHSSSPAAERGPAAPTVPKTLTARCDSLPIAASCSPASLCTSACSGSAAPKPLSSVTACARSSEVAPSVHSPPSTCRKSRGVPASPHSGQHASPKSPSRVPPLRSMKRMPVADGWSRVPSPPLAPRLVSSTTACHLG